MAEQPFVVTKDALEDVLRHLRDFADAYSPLTYEQEGTLLRWAVEALDVMDKLKTERDAARDRSNNHLSELSDLIEGRELARERERRLREALVQCREAFRLTHEFLGEKRLPAIEGWSWFDADNRAKALLEELRPIDRLLP